MKHLKVLLILGATFSKIVVPGSSIYSPIGKRDPFMKMSRSERGIATDENSLFKFQVEQFNLKGVQRGPDGNRILVIDPEGNNYVLREGERIGKTRAIVSRILDREVILSEQTQNYLGKTSISERILSLPGEE